MARRLAELPKGARISDYISLGVIAKTFPADKIEAVLAATGKTSVRQRELPAHVVVYYVIALALYMQSSCRPPQSARREAEDERLSPAAKPANLTPHSEYRGTHQDR